MPQPANNNNNGTPNLIVILIIALASWLILVPLANHIRLPFGENKVGVISVASLQNISPYTDYLKYIILVLIPPLIGALALNIKRSVIDQSLKIVFQGFNHPAFLILMTLILIISWFVNIPPSHTQFEIGKVLTDSFHEGEFLGFLPNFLQLDKPFAKTVIIHGFGLDVLPSLIAHKLAFFKNGIAMTRLFVNLENLIGYLGSFWILWELTQSVDVKKSKLKIFLLSCLLFGIFDDIFFRIELRRGAWFVIQLALTLRYLRTAHLSSLASKILPIFIGASIPLSFLYVYDRGIYFLPIYFCATIISLFSSQKLAKQWLRGTLTSLGVTLVFIISILGWDEATAIGSQILYWGKYGRYITFLPLPNLELTFVSQRFWLSMLIQTSVIIYLVFDAKINSFNFRLIFRKNALLLILLSAASVYMRITLDRSDSAHAFEGAFPTALLVDYLGLLAYKDYLEPRLIKLDLKPIYKIILTLLMIYLILAEPQFKLRQATAKLTTSYQSIWTPDTQLVQPEYLDAVTALKPEIDKQSCFLTITSEGLWYYLFNKPSCSKFSYVLYAKPKIAQESVIEELEKTQPEILLFTNDVWYKNPWDRVLTADSAAIIYQYLLTHYQPYKAIHSHWFWRHRQNPLKFTNNQPIQGFVDSVPTEPIPRGKETTINGWSVFPKKGKPVDAIYLSHGSQNQLISVARVNMPRLDVVQALSNQSYQFSGWKLRIPSGTLPDGQNILKLWGYDAETGELTAMGQEIMIEVISALR